MTAEHKVVERDHPRVCGENRERQRRKTAKLGSPPRVRGKSVPTGIVAVLPGITPACAGKIVVDCAAAGDGGDHPRVCGENEAEREAGFRFKGSPPRVRGKYFGNGVFPWLILVLSLDPL